MSVQRDAETIRELEAMIMHASKAIKTSTVKPLEHALERRDELEMCMDIMKAYTEEELEIELGEEWGRMLDEIVAPLYLVLRPFEALVRVAQLEEPL